MKKEYLKPEMVEVEICGNKNVLGDGGMEEASTGEIGGGGDPTVTPGGLTKEKSIWDYTAE